MLAVGQITYRTTNFGPAADMTPELLNVTQAYLDDIERLVAEDFLTDALEKLLDFVRDLAPSLRKDALALYANHSRVRRSLKYGTQNVTDLDRVVENVLLLAERAKSVALAAASETPATPAAPAKPDAEPPSAPTDEQIGHTLDDYRRVYITAMRRMSATASENTLVTATALTKRYGRSDFSLGPISFELLRGEITGVVGMNASGKTTLLNLITGRIRHQSGTLDYPALGAKRNWPRIKSQIAIVDQLPERWFGLLRHNLNHTAAAFGVFGHENEDLVDWYVHRYGLNEYADSTWDEISGGFRIRFELVRALLSRPELLVLDEPLAYLDIVTQQLFLSDLRSIASSLEQPIPIVVTSQHLHEIEAIADRMIILDDGKCLFSGPTAMIPEHNEFQCFEASIRASKADVLTTLRSVGLVDIEVSATSYLLFFPKSVTRKDIVSGLLDEFGDRLIAFRDISRSTRVLFRNKRDDLEAHGAAQEGIRRGGEAVAAH